MKTFGLAAFFFVVFASAAAFGVGAADRALDDEARFKIFTEAIRTADCNGNPCFPKKKKTKSGKIEIVASEISVPAAVATYRIVRLVFALETLQLALDLWSHARENIKHFASKFSDEQQKKLSKNITTSCSLQSIRRIKEGAEFTLHCPS